MVDLKIDDIQIKTKPISFLEKMKVDFNFEESRVNHLIKVVFSVPSRKYRSFYYFDTRKIEIKERIERNIYRVKEDLIIDFFIESGLYDGQSRFKGF